MKLSDLIKLKEEKEILRQCVHHFNSQAKPNSTPCRSEYYYELADKCLKLLHTIGDVVE